jgi:hypothetical protein
MPILTKEDPFPVERKIIWINPAQPAVVGSGYYPSAHTIRPRCLDDLFDMPEVIAVSTDLTLTQNRLRPDLKTIVWLRDSDGTIVEMNPDTAPIEMLRCIANYASNNIRPDPLELALQDISEANTPYYKITYLAHSTIVSWDDISLGVDDMVGEDPDLMEYGPDLGEIFGAAYAIAPRSNHEKLHFEPLVLQDLSDHTDLINIDTGFQFRAAKKVHTT